VIGVRLTPRYPFIDGEVKYAVQHEYAETAADFLARRTRLSFLDAEAALSALPEVIDMMGTELQWSEQRKESEWTDTVRFLGSMGLSESKMAITREEVMKDWKGQDALVPLNGEIAAVEEAVEETAEVVIAA
jgi:glycerol-3-phosphate dehydrogenase